MGSANPGRGWWRHLDRAQHQHRSWGPSLHVVRRNQAYGIYRELDSRLDVERLGRQTIELQYFGGGVFSVMNNQGGLLIVE
jgi:hypothetical protein